ncbi:MAG: DUF4157 domain-containing protein [Sandaracinaceae bacterium]|nr:DUF4157 domain-containing protein [Sandaracinaceae bacterium]
MGRGTIGSRMLFADEPVRRRSLDEAEQRIVVGALLACRVAEREVCERAARLTEIAAPPPRWWEVRGPRSLVAHMALASRADGVTLGRRVFVRQDLLTDAGAVPIALVAHEVAHVAQIVRDGFSAFYARSALDYVRGRARGLDDRRAYLAIPYEVEARAVAATADPFSE